MHSFLWAAAAAALLALAAARTDQDFEFDDDAESPATAAAEGAGGSHAHRPRRYVYDPHNSLCRSLVCKKREVCVLRDAFTALCATKKEILRKGDIIVAAGGGGGGGAWDAADAEWERGAAERAADERAAEHAAEHAERDADDDDVFYDAGAREPEPAPDADEAARCVGCPARARASFLCGSDNRTYSSLCRLDLHNCVRRGARPVRLACRGFCPCARRPHRRARPAHRARARARPDDYDTDWRRRKPDSSHNEVLPERQSRRRLAQGAEGCALDKMANRLLDWFSVLMDEAGATAPPADGFPSDCKPEVRWMFAHLDTDGDGYLSAANLYSLRHDERERCLRPFLSSCGGGGGGGAGRGVSRGAWCGCLRRAARPCTALARAHPAAARGGAYVPACDARGYYRPRQCHAALGVCWCVDAHGVELPGSRTKGAPSCPGEKSHVAETAASGSDGVSGGVEGAPADDEDGAGSGDSELHF
ncbi:proteoglycan Cow [Anticarsia gemmatalis]|uniref:proteoglycan Cow n=1 Tax=Anticarsia gemmatalis TaxID=129554 RepID=UPI003F7573FC